MIDDISTIFCQYSIVSVSEWNVGCIKWCFAEWMSRTYESVILLILKKMFVVSVNGVATTTIDILHKLLPSPIGKIANTLLPDKKLILSG